MPRLGRVGLLFGVAALMCACAPPPPVALHATFTDRAATRVAVPATAQSCRVHIAKLADGRRSPELLGIVLGRAVRAPPDADAWLHSIFGGLRSRGVMPIFEGSADDGATSAAVQITLLTAWVTDTASNKTANVVLHVQTLNPGAQPGERDYRGSTSTIDWAAKADELQAMVDRAFAVALDGMATDFRQLCSR